MGMDKEAPRASVDTAVARVKAGQPAEPGAGCLLERRPDPCSLVIVGASGDLTSRKLVPALYNLYLNDGLPDPVRIVGCSRTEMTDEGFRNKMERHLRDAGRTDLSRWEAFASNLHYRMVDYGDLPSFKTLSDFLRRLDREGGTQGNLIFDLALPPSLYGTVAGKIGQAGLSSQQGEGRGWSRIVIEKPFGRDLESAVELNRRLQQHFTEGQIFRIDHYLAKETVQNVLMLRFANAIFEPVWNRNYVENVEITAAENIGVGHRSGYYEEAGVLRDMFQNHMMQLLALTAMEPPSLFEAERVRDERAKVFRSLRPFPIEKIRDYVVLGQYGPGQINGEQVPGYQEEKGVAPDSQTPTYATMKVFIGNWRWKGVPFFLTSGKRLAKKLTEISIQFKEVPHSMFREVLGEHISANRLTLGVYPEEKITLTFQTKSPGAKVCLRSVTMDFNYHQGYTGPVLEAYEKVLLDAMLGDQTLFWRQDGLEACWSFLDPVLAQCDSLCETGQMLHPYEAGTWGPEAARGLQHRNEETWSG